MTCGGPRGSELNVYRYAAMYRASLSGTPRFGTTVSGSVAIRPRIQHTKALAAVREIGKRRADSARGGANARNHVAAPASVHGQHAWTVRRISPDDHLPRYDAAVTTAPARHHRGGDGEHETGPPHADTPGSHSGTNQIVIASYTIPIPKMIAEMRPTTMRKLTRAEIGR